MSCLRGQKEVKMRVHWILFRLISNFDDVPLGFGLQQHEYRAVEFENFDFDTKSPKQLRIQKVKQRRRQKKMKRLLFDTINKKNSNFSMAEPEKDG